MSRFIQKIHKFGIKIRKSKDSIFNTNTINKYMNSKLKIRKIVVNVYTDWESNKNILSLYLSVKRSHHIRRECLKIPTLIQKKKNIHVGFYEDLKV
jgi:hypothetical protein